VLRNLYKALLKKTGTGEERKDDTGYDKMKLVEKKIPGKVQQT
jgi:hypothetical protein